MSFKMYNPSNRQKPFLQKPCILMYIAAYLGGVVHSPPTVPPVTPGNVKLVMPWELARRPTGPVTCTGMELKRDCSTELLAIEVRPPCSVSWEPFVRLLKRWWCVWRGIQPGPLPFSRAPVPCDMNKLLPARPSPSLSRLRGALDRSTLELGPLSSLFPPSDANFLLRNRFPSSARVCSPRLLADPGLITPEPRRAPSPDE